MTNEDLEFLLSELLKYPKENEWLEFKINNFDPDEMGEYISALSNSAALNGKLHGYLIWGISDDRKIVGTTFDPFSYKTHNQEIESWLLNNLNPKINFKFYELFHQHIKIVILEINAATGQPVQFKKAKYIRIGSYTKKLKEYQEIERNLWKILDKEPFERQVALNNVTSEKVLELLDYQAYFKYLNLGQSFSNSFILEAFIADGLIKLNEYGKYDITNLAAILLARKLDDFDNINRKAVRLIIYNSHNKIRAENEIVGTKGYIAGFLKLNDYLLNILPKNEVIKKSLRVDTPMYPELAIREIIANALIHQDFTITGCGPTVELFTNRIEVTNPGTSLVKVDRLIDSPPRSRNEKLASFMRRFGICEERGSGIDKIVLETEFNQLPAPLFETPGEFTRVVLYAHKEFKVMSREDKIRACYLHSCLKWVQNEQLTNTSLRLRFGLDVTEKSKVSRIIRDCLDANLIKYYDENLKSKSHKYNPFWAN